MKYLTAQILLKSIMNTYFDVRIKTKRNLIPTTIISFSFCITQLDKTEILYQLGHCIYKGKSQTATISLCLGSRLYCSMSRKRKLFSNNLSYKTMTNKISFDIFQKPKCISAIKYRFREKKQYSFLDQFSFFSVSREILIFLRIMIQAVSN